MSYLQREKGCEEKLKSWTMNCVTIMKKTLNLCTIGWEKEETPSPKKKGRQTPTESGVMKSHWEFAVVGYFWKLQKTNRCKENRVIWWSQWLWAVCVPVLVATSFNIHDYDMPQVPTEQCLQKHHVIFIFVTIFTDLCDWLAFYFFFAKNFLNEHELEDFKQRVFTPEIMFKMLTSTKRCWCEWGLSMYHLFCNIQMALISN